MRNSLLITSYSFLKIYDKFTKFDIIFSIYDSIKCSYELVCKLKIMFWKECDIILVD